MRNLTITRSKTFVACAMKDHVYLQDDTAPELTINGVGCRKIGELKNGEQKTFQIGEGQQQVFLIADKLSKEYCNASITVPAGEADVSLSGKHHFVLGSNPFRFDGTAVSKSQKKKNSRIGLTITAVAAVIGVIFGFVLTRGLFSAKTPEAKVFTKGDFQITLTEAFSEETQPGMFATYSSKTAIVFAVREEISLVGDISLEEYSRLVMEVNGYADKEMAQKDGYCWFDYIDAPQGEDIYYMVACYRTEDAFFVVNFATPAVNQAGMHDTFHQWAATVGA